MRKHMNFILLSLFLSLISCSKEELPNDSNKEPETPTAELRDTVDFRVLAYVDKPSVMGHLGGSERVVRQKMEKLFQDVTAYWNKSANGRLDFYYRFVLGDMVIYDCGSDDPELNKRIYNDPMDFTKYDVAILFDALQDHDDDRGSGGAAGGGSDNRTVITVIAGDEPKDLFDKWTRNTVTHELGHYRGVTDVYQYIIAAEDNPVSHQRFDPPACIMNWADAGVWCDYAINCMNLAGDAKRIGLEYPRFFESLYPKSIDFTVRVDGKPQRGVKIELYPSRAGAADHNRDIYPEVYVSGSTGGDGKWVLNDLENYIIPNKDKHPEINIPPSLSYWRCFGFLAKISYDGKDKFVWMSEIDLQMVTFEGKDIYSVEVDF